LLQKHSSPAVKNENAESPVQQAFPVRFHFFHYANRLVVFIYQYHLLHTPNLMHYDGMKMKNKTIANTVNAANLTAANAGHAAVNLFYNK
jgi:hypothetical protein